MPNPVEDDSCRSLGGQQSFANGTRISKLFACPETGREKLYRGEVKRFEEVEGRLLYWVKYEDGDAEHMSEREVQKCLASDVASKPSTRLERKPRFAKGTLVAKSFLCPQSGTETTYHGKVKRFEPVDGQWRYWIKYEDGDTEHMSEREVANHRVIRAVKREVESEALNSCSTEKRARVSSDDGNQDGKRRKKSHIRPSAKVRHAPKVKQEPQEDTVAPSLVRRRLDGVGEGGKPTEKSVASTSKVRSVRTDYDDRKMNAKRQRRSAETPLSEDVRDVPIKEESQEEDPVSAKIGRQTGEVAKRSQNAIVLHRKTQGERRNREDRKTKDTGQADSHLKTAEEGLPKEAPTAPAVDRNEKCPLCEKAPMKKPRATPCHHIFCKACVQGYYSQNDHFCPVCRLPGELKLTRSSDSPAFKPVEALNKLTGEVVHSFGSASAASMKLAKAKGRAMRIIDACQSRRRDDRAFVGYYWRFTGSGDRILRLGEATRDGIPIEQVCLETGKVLNVFASSRKAQEKTGVVRQTIRRVLRREGKANAGGFFWRFAGEDHGPWPDPEFVEKTAVEQLSLETGEVLASFRSLADAQRHMGIHGRSHIGDCCNGERRSAYGFFFRWKGSDSMPLLKYRGKRVQLSKTKGGKVLKEFPNARIASEIFGYDFTKICRWCREEERSLGYWWRYDPDQFDATLIPPGERLVGKRISLLEGGEWIEGKLIEYHGSDDSHSIQLDRGDVIRFVLSKTQHELKSDHGQKPVEQIDIDTGEVLNTFPSLRAASQSVSNTRHISSVLKGNGDTAGGFFWRYKGSTAQPRKPKTRKVVEQLCLKTGRVLATHKSISAAGKAVGISTPGISYCCNGRNYSQSAGGFGWRFAKEKVKTES